VPSRHLHTSGRELSGSWRVRLIDAPRAKLITSVGFPIIPASPPAIPAHAMVDPAESFAPFRRCQLRARMSYNANRAVEYVVWRRIEADRPDQRDRMPATSEAGVTAT
jgi:hypothetical protein